MRVSRISGHGLVALVATVVVLQGTGNAIAQFAPLALPAVNSQNQAYTPNQVYTQQNQLPAQGRYQANAPHQAYAQNQAYAPNQVYTPKQVYPQNQVYRQNLNQIYSQNQRYPQPQAQMQPQYTAMAFQANGNQVAIPATDAMAPVPMQGGGNAAQSGPGCSTCQSAPAGSYGSCGNGGCATGGCAGGGSGYNTFANSCGYGGIGAGCGGLGAQRGCGRRWFGGFYGLYMERVGGNSVPLGFSTTTLAVGYYPTDSEVSLYSPETGYQAGAEVRFGSTLGNNGAAGCGPSLGWEFAYWGLQEETETARIDDAAYSATDGNRTYSMIDFRGLEANMGTGYRPVNSYFDYAPPVADHSNDPGFVGVDVEVRSLVARSTFTTQSLELNLLRLPVFGGGLAAGSCASGGCDGSASSGYLGGGGTGGRLGSRGGGYSYGGPRHSLTTLLGFRYVRFDEAFSLRSNYETYSGGVSTGTGFISYGVEADNHLVGFQMGCNGVSRLGCQGRWAFHYGTSVGIYGNRIEMSQRMDVPTGGAVRFVNGTQSNFSVDSTKDEVALLAELRVGGSYQYSGNWRFYGGWRALGATGIGLATAQVPTAFITPGGVGYIDSSGSLFLHGLQTGVECTY